MTTVWREKRRKEISNTNIGMGSGTNARYQFLSLVVYEHLFQVATVYDALMIWPRQGGTKNIGPSQTVVLPTE